MKKSYLIDCKFDLIAKSVFSLFILLTLIGCDQHNLKSSESSNESSVLTPATPEIKGIFPNQLYPQKADAILNGKMFYIDSTKNVYTYQFAKMDSGKLKFLESDVDFSVEYPYSEIIPDDKGGFYLVKSINLKGDYTNEQFIMDYLDVNGKIKPENSIKFEMNEGSSESSFVKIPSSSKEDFILIRGSNLTKVGSLSINNIFKINTLSHKVEPFNFVVKVCSQNSDPDSNCSEDLDWVNSTGLVSAGSITGFSRALNGKKLYYLTPRNKYIYFNGQFYTGLISIDIISNEVNVFNFDLEVKQADGSYIPVSDTVFGNIKISGGYSTTPQKLFKKYSNTVSFSMGTFFNSTSNNYQFKVSDLTRNITVSMAVASTKFASPGNILYTNFSTSDFIFQKTLAKPSNCGDDAATYYTGSYLGSSDEIVLRYSNSKSILNCFVLKNDKLIKTTGYISNNIASSDIINGQTEWETSFTLGLDQGRKYNYYDRPLYINPVTNFAYMTAVTNIGGFDTEPTLLEINLENGVLNSEPYKLNGNFDSAEVTVSGDAVLFSKLRRTFKRSVITSVDPVSNSKVEHSFIFKRAGFVYWPSEVIDGMIPLKDEKLLIYGRFLNVNDIDTQQFFIYDTKSKSITPSPFIFSNVQTYFEGVYDEEDGSFMYYQRCEPLQGSSGYYLNFDRSMSFKFLDNKLYVAGCFDRVNSESRYGFAVIDVENMQLTPFSPVPASFTPPALPTDDQSPIRALGGPSVFEVFKVGDFNPVVLMYASLHSVTNAWDITKNIFRLDSETGTQISQTVINLDGRNVKFIKNQLALAFREDIYGDTTHSDFYDFSTGQKLSWPVLRSYFTTSADNAYISDAIVINGKIIYAVKRAYVESGGLSLFSIEIKNNQLTFSKDLSNFVPLNESIKKLKENESTIGFNYFGVKSLEVFGDNLIVHTFDSGNIAIPIKDLGL